MLSNEELCLLASQRDEDRNKYLLELFQQNRGLIIKCIQPYIGINGACEDDLMQEAFLGVIETVDHFDATRGRFTNILPYWVKNVVLKSLNTEGTTTRIPGYMQQRIRQYTKLVSEFRKTYGSEPADVFIRMQLNLTQDQLEQLRKAIFQSNMRSLEEPVAEGLILAECIADNKDLIVDIEDQVDKKKASEVIWSEVAKLDPRQADTIAAKYRDGLSFKEVAEKLQITPDQVRTAITNGCNCLARKKSIKLAAESFDYSSLDLYGGGLQSFLHNGSAVERAAFKMLEQLNYLDTQAQDD